MRPGASAHHNTSYITVQDIDSVSRRIYDADVNSSSAAHEVQRDWRAILREQGRSMVWLAGATETSYATVVNYMYRRSRPSEEWERRVYELLGEPIR